MTQVNYLRRYAELVAARQGLTPEDDRESHFAFLLEALEAVDSQDLSCLRLSPYDDGLSEEESVRRYERVGKVFEQKVGEQPKNPVLLMNFCAFLRGRDPRRALEIAETRLLPLQPNDPEIYDLIAGLKSFLAGEAQTAKEMDSDREAVYEALKAATAIRGEDIVTLNFGLMKLAWAAYDTRHGEARDLALRCIDRYGELVGRPVQQSIQPGVYFNAHTILGLIALDSDDASGATAHLLASVDLPKNETNLIEYPALELAHRLLSLGYAADVSQFLRRLEGSCGPCDASAVAAFAKTAGGASGKLQ